MIGQLSVTFSLNGGCGEVVVSGDDARASQVYVVYPPYKHFLITKLYTPLVTNPIYEAIKKPGFCIWGFVLFCWCLLGFWCMGEGVYEDVH